MYFALLSKAKLSYVYQNLLHHFPSGSLKLNKRTLKHTSSWKFTGKLKEHLGHLKETLKSFRGPKRSSTPPLGYK